MTILKQWCVAKANDPKWAWFFTDYISAFAKREAWNKILVSQGKAGDLVVYRVLGILVLLCEGEFISDGPYGPFVKNYVEKDTSVDCLGHFICPTPDSTVRVPKNYKEFL